MLREAHERGHEGLVFRHRRAPYTPGRPASDGPAIKYKLYTSCTAKVAAANDKRSVSLKLYDETDNGIPSVGDVVEIRYLYAYRGGSLYQPVYLGKRTDMDQSDCKLSQLKYKGEGSESAA